MAQANSHDTTNLSGLARQQAERVQALDTLKRLRREARAEIERLINLLDQSDDYVKQMGRQDWQPGAFG
ncbi:hypothetical protein [Bradyrhizobium retamae]|uniref:hypothetical protein n=1 Tax=Bradyrhizobium retamae TaxID=1300035 RepID=UPI0007C7AB48|nr:hypothetical protein [Bradyrhizobium retamae]